MAAITDTPLVDQTYKLEKFPGKGGWTFVVISEIPKDKRSKFGQIRVKGSIDSYTFNHVNLMPMSNGKLFFSVNAEIRKIIGKEEGDSVKIVLFEDNLPIEIPQELVDCLKEEPEAYQNFTRFSESAKNEYVKWIYSAKSDKTKVERIVKMMGKVLQGLKLSQ